MQRLGVGLGLGIATAAMLVSCIGFGNSVIANAQAVCGVVCKCESPGDTDAEMVLCIDQCASNPQLAPLFEEACADCIIENGDSCGTVGDVCRSACQFPEEPDPTTQRSFPGGL
ncbi:MAG: hypothetical protein H0T79_21025 [Deltaproteobacteria bacterium]|nr:hypothetical protein [Deltaproteobacteria bacterium]